MKKEPEMQGYSAYIETLGNVCLLVDLNEQQHFLRAKLDKDTGFLARFMGLNQQLQKLSNDNCANWLNDSVASDLLSTILSEWDEQVVRLNRMIVVLGILDKKQRSDGLPQETRDRIHKIYQEMEWSNIRSSLDSIDSPAPQPTTPEHVSPSEDELAWKKASSLGTLAAYKEYLGRTGAKGFENDAREAIKRLVENDDNSAWTSAKSENTIAGYERYLARTRAKKYQVEAEKALAQLNEVFREEAIWRAALAQDSVAGYVHYKKETQLKKYLTEADDAIRRLTEIEEDEKAWGDSEKENTLAAYERYRDRPGTKRYLDKALEAIKALTPPGPPGLLYCDC